MKRRHLYGETSFPNGKGISFTIKLYNFPLPFLFYTIFKEIYIMKTIKKLAILLTLFMLISVSYAEEISSNTETTNGNIMPVSSNLTVTSSIKLNGISVDEQGMRIINEANMCCTFSISNLSSTPDGIVAILATYTAEGRFYNIEIYDIDIEAGETKNVEIIYQFDAENEHIGKLMIWNSYTNFIPLRASIDFSQTSGINAYYYTTDNRLLQIDKANGKSVIFTYDKMGNLLSRTVRK